jgi:plasmid stabilization system protein ParE
MDPAKSPALSVVYSAGGAKELDGIWDWNDRRYTADHADQYIEFLERHIDALSIDHRQGKPVGSRPDLSYILIRRKAKGHGHIAVYSVDEKQIKILHVFHSAQDWQTKLIDEGP